MTRITRPGIALLALLGLAGWVPTASANDFFDDLIGTGGTPRQEYDEDVRQARQEYDRNQRQAYENYNRDRQRAGQTYNRDRYARGGGYSAYQKYQEALYEAEERYRSRLTRAQREYYDDQRKAQDRYRRNQQREYDRYYRQNNRRRGEIWDRSRYRQHQNEWNRRGRNHYPDYGYDYSDYYWDRGNYDRYSRNNGYQPYRHGQPYRQNQVTYWSTGNDWGYYRDHNENGAGSWNLSVDFGVPGGHGYVNRDPYTYGRGHRYPYQRYRTYMTRDRRLRYNNRNDDYFRLSTGSNYYGDSYMYGDLFLTF